MARIQTLAKFYLLIVKRKEENKDKKVREWHIFKKTVPRFKSGPAREVPETQRRTRGRAIEAQLPAGVAAERGVRPSSRQRQALRED